MVAHRDVVIALVATSATLTGLVLVFLGLILAAYSGLYAGTERSASDTTRRRYRRVGAVLLGSFLLGLCAVVAAAVWLVRLGGSQGLYVAVLVLFFAQVVTLGGTTIWTLAQLLWG